MVDFIKTPEKDYRPKPKKIKIITGKEQSEMQNKQELKKALKMHKKSIKQAKADIKKYKLLMKQAKLTYKISR